MATLAEMDGVRFGKQRPTMNSNPLLRKAGLGKVKEGAAPPHAKERVHGRKSEKVGSKVGPELAGVGR